MAAFEDDYCGCGEILMLYEKKICDKCYGAERAEKKVREGLEVKTDHDANLRDLAEIVRNGKRRKEK